MFDPFDPHLFLVFGTSFHKLTPYPGGSLYFTCNFSPKYLPFCPSFLKSQVGNRRLGKAMRKRSKCTDRASRLKIHTGGLGLPEVKIMCFCLFVPYPGVRDHYQTIRHFISTDVTYP